MDNLNNPNDYKNKNIENNPAVIKTSVKTIYLDAGGDMDLGRSILGIIFIFFCVFAVCWGLIACVSESFRLEANMFNIALLLLVSELFFTLIYFLPSRIFTLIGFLIGSGGVALYIMSRLDYIKEAAYYVLNLGLYRIREEGYNVGGIVDGDYVKKLLNTEAAAGYVNIIAVLAGIFLTAIFSYLLYSKKNIIYSLLISVMIVFPGFFYGLIPTKNAYMAFAFVGAFWVAQFAINLYESNYMAYVISKENTVPEKRLEKYKLKMFRQQYNDNIKSIKTEIKTILKSPNRNENSIRLDKLVRQLNSISDNQKLFLFFCGLDGGQRPKQKEQGKQKKNEVDINKNNKNNKEDNTVNIKTNENADKSGKFINPVKIEKQRLAAEKQARKESIKSARQAERQDFAGKPLSSRLKIRFANNFAAKKKYSVKGGYAGFLAFVIAFAALTVVQPFISPTAKFNISMPEKVLTFLTNTIEYTLVGSDSSVYGGYNGGMGGGFLYRPGGVKFQNKPILKVGVEIDPRTRKPYSNSIYLKGWTGTIYTGNMWQEADKKQIEEYNGLSKNSSLRGFKYISEKEFFEIFTQNMQNIFNVTITDPARRDTELKYDAIDIEHLVSGGRLSFMPYFSDDRKYASEAFNFKPNADLNVRITNSLFKYPVYSVNFYSAETVMNREPQAIEDFKEYIDYYYSLIELPANFEKYFSRFTPKELKELISADIRFYSGAGYALLSEANLEELAGEGKFYPYSPPNEDYAYIYIPDKYEDVLVIGNNNRFPVDYILSEMAYNKFAREYYLGLPENFPEDVVNLALEITQGLDTDYEKALAIERYIARRYSYTLNPHPPYDPKADFVFNFLFDQYEGYCTAYASAMVTMMRSLGIPARYAEGYTVKTSKRQQDKSTGNYYIIIQDDDGHAWPEVYLRGIGWVPFEPTKSYIDPSEAEQATTEYVPPSIRPYPEMNMGTTAPNSEDDDDSPGTKAVKAPTSFYIILGIIAACLAVYLLNKIITSNRLNKFKSAKTNAAVLRMLAYILAFLKHCGFVMHNEEGLKEFARRVSPNFEMINPDGWEKAAEIMQKARYSRHEITEGERFLLYEFVEAIRKECMQKLKFDLKFKMRFVYFIL